MSDQHDGVKVPVFDRESPGSGRASSIEQPTQNVFFEIVKVATSMLMIDNGIQAGGSLQHVYCLFWCHSLVLLSSVISIALIKLY